MIHTHVISRLFPCLQQFSILPVLCILFVVTINVVSNGLSFFLTYVRDLFPRHTDCHCSCGVHGITDMIFVIATLLQMERMPPLRGSEGRGGAERYTNYGKAP